MGKALGFLPTPPCSDQDFQNGCYAEKASRQVDLDADGHSGAFPHGTTPFLDRAGAALLGLRVSAPSKDICPAFMAASVQLHAFRTASAGPCVDPGVCFGDGIRRSPQAQAQALRLPASGFLLSKAGS
jgi:hypothetical protein